MNMKRKRLHVIISGQVQGVAFRAYARRRAEVLGLTGWVRNLPDGRVEAVFEGHEQMIAAILAWCRQGPPAASVEDVLILEEAPARGEFASFEIRF